MRLQALVTLALFSGLTVPSPAARIIVDQAGGGDYVNIQWGINAAGDGDTVAVRSGVYTGENNVNLDFGGTNIVLEAENPLLTTFIDCGGAANTRAFYFHSGEDTTSVVRWLTIENGATTGEERGGGVYCGGGSSPVFDTCMFFGHTSQDGGAVYAEDSDPIFRTCIFAGNTAGQQGGGICCVRSGARIYDCHFEDNDCGMGGVGGGICASDDPPLGRQAPVIRRSTFVGCGVENFGGAIYCRDSSPVIENCLFYDNSALFGGGGICCDGASPSIANCTIARSSSFGGGSGIYCGKHEGATPSSPTVTNTIVAFGAGEAPGVACGGPGDTPTITHCVVFGNAGGDDLCGDHHDNIIYDPLFCDAVLDDFFLCEDSRCLPGNSPWGELIGRYPADCPPCDTPVESVSWGAIKVLYR